MKSRIARFQGIGDVRAMSPSVLDAAALRRSVSHAGAANHLAPLFQKLYAGLPIVMGVWGASVAQNAGCLDQAMQRCMQFNGRQPFTLGWGSPRSRPFKGWAVRFMEHINTTWPHALHRINNSAADKTSASHALPCLMTKLPSSLDLVLLEFNSMARHQKLPGLEGVVRQLLSLPSQPVIVIVSVHSWCLANFVGVVEAEADRVCRWYGQACLSQKRGLEPLVRAGNVTKEQLVGRDCIHPLNGPLGVDTITEILNHWLDRSRRRYLAQQQQQQQRQQHQPPHGALNVKHASRRTMPVPIWPDNARERHSRCYVFAAAVHKPRYLGHVQQAVGQQHRPLRWRTTWCPRPGAWLVPEDSGVSDEAGEACHEPAEPPAAARCPEGIVREGGELYRQFLSQPPRGFFYCGYELRPPGLGASKQSSGVLGVVPGATLHFEATAGIGSETANKTVAHLSYLTSYRGMGVAVLRCVGACSCAASEIDAHDASGGQDTVFQTRSVSLQLPAGGFEVSCVLQLQIINRTSSGHHKFKVRTLTLETSSESIATGSSTALMAEAERLSPQRRQQGRKHRQSQRQAGKQASRVVAKAKRNEKHKAQLRTIP